MRPRLRRIAAAGNTAAVALLAMVYAHGPALLERAETPPALPAAQTDSKVLLVVIDALREDRSRDPFLMPNLNRLPGRGTARVESWIPSTVAGIRTIVEGTVPPPASFLQDFGATQSPDGGIFAAAKTAGFRTFAAGPRLWEDLYGPWLDGAFSVITVSADDERVLREGIAALRSGYGLVVVHLSAADDAAHVDGGSSREYLDALRQADAALGQLLDAAGPEIRVVVTSDHGVTDQGGHAGPEATVVETPVVVRGIAAPGSIFQRDLHRLISEEGRDESRPYNTPVREGCRGAIHCALLCATLACALILCTRLSRGEEEWPSAILLDLALWISLVLAVLGWIPAALLLTLAVLATAALRRSPRTISLPALAILGAGLTFGILRLQTSWAGSLHLLAVLGLAAVLGWALRRPLPLHPLLIGGICGVLPAVLAGLLGETTSLSTLDVRFAFRLTDTPLGLPGAVTAVVLLQALPTLVFLAGLAPALSRPVTGPFVAGAALVLTGQAGAAALALSLSPGPLAVGLLVRLIGEVSFLFLGLAVLSRRSGTVALKNLEVQP